MRGSRTLVAVAVSLSLAAWAGRKIPTSKSTYGPADTGQTADLTLTNDAGTAITMHSTFVDEGGMDPTAIFYHLQFNQPVPSPLELDFDVPFEPDGPDPDGGPFFGLAFDQELGTSDWIVLLTPCSTATTSQDCSAGSQCACEAAILVDPTGGSSPVRFVLDSTQLPGAPTTFNTGDELIVFLTGPGDAGTVVRPATSFLTATSAGQPLSVGTGDLLTLNVSVPVPAVSSLAPSRRLKGLTVPSVAASGTGFIYGASATFDAAPRVTHFASTAALTVDLLSSDLAAGAHSFVVVNPSQPAGGGPSAAASFDVVAPSLSPSSGFADGGTMIAVDGVDFSQISSVTIGGVAASNVVIASDTKLTMMTPPHPPGVVDVAFITDAGTCVLDGGYTFLPPGSSSTGGGAGGGVATGGGNGGSGGSGGGTGGGSAVGGGTGGGGTGAAGGGSGGGGSGAGGCGCSSVPGAELLLVLLLGARRQRQVAGRARVGGHPRDLFRARRPRP